MTGYKSLDLIIGARHFHGTYVSSDVETDIATHIPPDCEYLSGRIVALDEEKMMLILIFELVKDRAVKKSVNVRISLKKVDGENSWYDCTC